MRVTASADWLPVFLVGHILHPLDMLAVERLLHRDVNHAGVGRSAMPVLLVRRNPHRVAGLDLADRPALRLHTTDAGDDMQGLSKRMRVPRGARARLEAHAARANARRRRRLDDRVLPRHAGERFLRLTARRY